MRKAKGGSRWLLRWRNPKKEKVQPWLSWKRSIVKPFSFMGKRNRKSDPWISFWFHVTMFPTYLTTFLLSRGAICIKYNLSRISWFSSWLVPQKCKPLYKNGYISYFGNWPVNIPTLLLQDSNIIGCKGKRTPPPKKKKVKYSLPSRNQLKLILVITNNHQ